MGTFNCLLITELFSPTRGGSAVWFDKAYRVLGGKGSVVITALVPGSDTFDAGYPLSVRRLPLERRWYYRPESLGMYVELGKTALSLAFRNKFHSIHAGRVLPEGLVALLVARLAGRPLLVYAHGEEITTWTQPWKARFLRFVYRKADAVIANSEFTAQLLDEIGVNHSRIHLIHPGVDLQACRPGLDATGLRQRYQLEGKMVLLSVGRLSRRKGFDHVIKALPRILEQVPHAHHVIVGIGEDERYLRNLVRDLALDSHVTFAGAAGDDELPIWYNLCDCFIMPNRRVENDSEGFGMVFIEANACGKPVIAGIDGGTGSAVLDGVTGIRVDGEDIDAVAGAAVRLLSDPDYAQCLGRAGMERARSSFGWEHVAENTVEVLKRL